MPEGKLRSGVYRSFIMCDDPRGVVECGAIKKQSKSRGCICNQRFDHPWKAKERSEMAPRKSTEDAPPSSLQLLRVSKGIQKLNVAIDSWSKGSSYETVDIAKGLLRGALDLEESLAMLQEEQKPRVSKDGRRDLRFRRSMSDRFGERIEKWMMVQENVASKDCYDESFLRQTTTSRVVRSDFASSSGAASSSTSSSQSSMVTGSTKSSASSQRAPSLIARLMGLDVSHQEPNHIDMPNIIANLSSERQEKLKKNRKKESPETVRCNSTREAVPSENPSTIVLIRPMNIVHLEMVEKPEKKGPKKPRMQGEEVHPRMINHRKDHKAQGASKRSSNQMKLPVSLTKKDREPKGIQENEGKPVETNKKISVKKEDIGQGKERFRPHDQALKPPTNHGTHKKSNSSSDMSRNKNRRSRLSSSASSSDEQKSNSREKKSGEASRRSAKKKPHPRDNDENNSSSSQETITQHSAEETTCTEFHMQGQCDNGEVSSCPVTVHPETSQISLKSFLSNSSNFISYAANLVDLNTNTKRSQETTYQDIVISDQRIALDFAKEVAKRRSLLLITEPTCPQRSSVHIDELLMEVCDGFESLRSYRDTFLGQSSIVKESMHMVLDKDLNSKKTEMTSGVWDLGWRSEFQIYETHQAVVDLEKIILSGLIQEILS